MRWPWSRKSDQVPDIDDWTISRTVWLLGYVCHCGHAVSLENGEAQKLGLLQCPYCGHRDKWKLRTYRTVCEWSPSRYKYFSRYLPAFKNTFERNHRTELWTEAHCTFNQENP